MPKSSILPIQFAHPTVELGLMHVGEKNVITVYGSHNFGKTYQPYFLCDLDAAISFIDKLEPLN